MAGTSGPLVPRHRLASELRRLRESAGLNLDQVSHELLISTSKLSRLENAQGSPQARDVRDLIRLYGIDGTQLARDLMRWVGQARQTAWWADRSDVISTRPPGFDAHVSYETEASVAKLYTVPVLPSLLQTPEYIREFYRSAEDWRTDEELDHLVDLRLRRQAVLTDRRSGPPLRLVAVTHEASLRQIVGSPTIMIEQLDALIERSSEPNVDLRIFPFSAPPAFVIAGSFAIFEFDEDAQRDTVSIETHAGFRHIETSTAVTSYQQHFQQLQDRCLDRKASRALIKSIASDLH